jgi:DNA-binding NarL/FixJ family response regulator
MKIILCDNRDDTRARWKNSIQPLFDDLVEITSVENLLQLLEGNGQSLLLCHEKFINSAETKELIERYPFCKIIIFSDNPDDRKAAAYLSSGVAGYANTYLSPKLMPEMIHVVNSGRVWVGVDLMRRIVSLLYEKKQGAPQGIENKASKSLTDRELQIAQFVARGKSNKIIAVELGITERTVKAHLNTVYKKTSTRSRLELALLMNR